MESLQFFAGMLSKSRGQMLRIATVLHLLFSIENPDQPLGDEVSERALKAAVNFVQTACQQTAYIAGRGTIEEELQKFKTGMLRIYFINLFIAPFWESYEYVVLCSAKYDPQQESVYALVYMVEKLVTTYLVSVSRSQLVAANRRGLCIFF